MSFDSASDGWAVGSYMDRRSDFHALVEHWDGALWDPLAIDLRPGDYVDLEAISADARDDAWMVGSYDRRALDHPLAMHWDGRTWTKLPTAGLGAAAYAGFNAVAAGSPSDAWAVGYLLDATDLHQLIERWDGTRWSRWHGRGPAKDLTGVSAVSPSDAWIVSSLNRPNYPRPSGFSEHFDGLSWRRYPLPGQHISGISATSASDAWAVGWTEYEGDIDGLTIQHWDGSSWRCVFCG